jgi:hypothetical protein
MIEIIIHLKLKRDENAKISLMKVLFTIKTVPVIMDANIVAKIAAFFWKTSK